VLGVKVMIFLPQDPKGEMGPKIPLDDVVTILEPKEEISPAEMLAQQASVQQSSAPSYSQPPMADAPEEEQAPMDPTAEAGF
jgi:small subunit ribosomal protein S3e